MKVTKFTKWLDSLHFYRVALELECSAATIQNWREGRAVPPYATAKKIIAVSGNKLNYQDIYSHFDDEE